MSGVGCVLCDVCGVYVCAMRCMVCGVWLAMYGVYCHGVRFCVVCGCMCLYVRHIIFTVSVRFCVVCGCMCLYMRHIRLTVCGFVCCAVVYNSTILKYVLLLVIYDGCAIIYICVCICACLCVIDLITCAAIWDVGIHNIYIYI